MGYNLAYKSRYHDDIRKQIERYGMPNHWEPYNTRYTKSGGVLNGITSTHPWKNMSDYLNPDQYKDKKTYRSGNSIGWNYYNRNVLNEINEMKEPYSFMQGGVVTRPYFGDSKPKIQEGPLKESILKTLSPEEKKIQGGVSLKKTERKLKRVEKKAAPIAKKVGKKTVSKGLDIGFDILPTVAASAASETGPLAFPIGVATGVVSKKARKAIKSKTGFGIEQYKPQEGGVSFKDIKKATKKVTKKGVKKGVSIGLDLALNQGVGALAKNIAPEIGLPPKATELVVKAVGKEVRKGIKSKTGFGQKKKANPWIEHLKVYSKKNNISYREALKSPQAKSAYRNK